MQRYIDKANKKVLGQPLHTHRNKCVAWRHATRRNSTNPSALVRVRKVRRPDARIAIAMPPRIGTEIMNGDA